MPRPSAPRRLTRRPEQAALARGRRAAALVEGLLGLHSILPPRHNIFHTSNMSHMRNGCRSSILLLIGLIPHPPVLIVDRRMPPADAPSIGAFAEDCVCLSVGKRERRAMSQGFIRPHRLAA